MSERNTYKCVGGSQHGKRMACSGRDALFYAWDDSRPATIIGMGERVSLEPPFREERYTVREVLISPYARVRVLALSTMAEPELARRLADLIEL